MNTGKEGNGMEHVFQVLEQDVRKRVRLGGFELLRTDGGIMYRNNAGFHLWVAPYVVGLDGKAKETSLYSMLSTLMDLSESDGKDDAGRFAEALSIAVECVCTWPLVAFSETETPAADFLGIDAGRLSDDERDALSMPMPFFFAKRLLDYLTAQAEKMVGAEAKEDGDESVRILAEDKADMERTEILSQIIGDDGGKEAGA